MLKSQKVIMHGALIGAFCLAAQQRAQASLAYTISNGYVGGATESGYADLQVVNVSLDHSGPMSVFCGGIQITEAGAPVAGAPTQYTTVCTDLNATLYLGDTYTYNKPTTSFNGLTGIDPTWGAANGVGATSINTHNATEAIENAAFIFYTFGQLTSRGINGTADQMAGLQLAIWLSLYDTTTSGQVLVNGSSRMQISGNGGDTAAVTYAMEYLSAVNSGNAGNYSYEGGILAPNPGTPDNGSPYNNSNYDDQPPQELFVAVPEPSTFVAGAMSLMPLGLASLRFFRARVTSKS